MHRRVYNASDGNKMEIKRARGTGRDQTTQGFRTRRTHRLQSLRNVPARGRRVWAPDAVNCLLTKDLLWNRPGPSGTADRGSPVSGNRIRGTRTTDTGSCCAATPADSCCRPRPRRRPAVSLADARRRTDGPPPSRTTGRRSSGRGRPSACSRSARPDRRDVVRKSVTRDAIAGREGRVHVVGGAPLAGIDAQTVSRPPTRVGDATLPRANRSRGADVDARTLVYTHRDTRSQTAGAKLTG